MCIIIVQKEITQDMYAHATCKEDATAPPISERGKKDDKDDRQ